MTEAQSHVHSKAQTETQADVLAMAAHRDDVEQTCGGTLLRMRAQGYRTAILDMTQGEAGTRGNAESRAKEAAAAARILGAGWRGALDIPDGRVENTYENRLKIVAVLRRLRPRVVILPYWTGRHPDHYTTATLGYEACFLAGLAKVETDAPPHRPFKILYASLYADVRPSFVVDITPHIEERHRALMAYTSQYANQAQGSGLFVPEEEIRERTFAMARYFGMLAGVRYAEPFVQKEVGLVEDIAMLGVASI
ncbi:MULTISPECIES: bacillithiol biosynthesis deacetylase BshB1 [Acidobacterium]|uniref:GlcNAc-PI de-N-acetylase family protein n=1 Tax=Acidobacterium capsulatum (strain ATCC 51196 / DSM 11244 / BCRC 80197 / JCM 7670 / NBRC 15755 / NCIMB 13165 / 161) TaxID=240015 RepID=C1F3L0_ACIC5|nr:MULTISPECIES: bacillithiol biosynthesis deacetylase BshB1 [Acidobacterium]ACO32732.1 GlcNAc-PI de-N-acetylase family protein [Acidobacterium capsulatum ATCC 51196]HCT60235.1 bacillithiol biosynthesis deacetylase BshB1 [Acidobacterium sp.]